MDLFWWVVGGGSALFLLLCFCRLFWSRRVSFALGILLVGLACQIGLGFVLAERMPLPVLAVRREALVPLLAALLIPVWALDAVCRLTAVWPRAVATPVFAGLALLLAAPGLLLDDVTLLAAAVPCLDVTVFFVTAFLLEKAHRRDWFEEGRALEAQIAAHADRATSTAYARRRPVADTLNRPPVVLCLVALVTMLTAPLLRAFGLPTHVFGPPCAAWAAWLGLHIGLRAEARNQVTDLVNLLYIFQRNRDHGPLHPSLGYHPHTPETKRLWLLAMLVRGLVCVPIVTGFVLLVVCAAAKGLTGAPLDAVLTDEALFPLLYVAPLYAALAFAAGLALGALLLFLFGNPFPPVEERMLALFGFPPPDAPEDIAREPEALEQSPRRTGVITTGSGKEAKP